MKAHLPSPTAKQPLTVKQQEVLRFLQKYTEEHGFPPTIKEIGDRFSFASTNAVTQYLLALERKGYIRRSTKGASRGIQILDFIPQPKPHHPPSTASYSTPAHTKALSSFPYHPYHQTHGVKNIIIVGEGIAQNPLSAFLSPRGQIRIDIEFFLPEPSSQEATEYSPPQLFAALVCDDAMRSDGLHEGDLVIAKQQFSASHNDIVVAIVRDTVLVRRYRILDTVHELSASADSYSPIPLSPDSHSIAIIGIVIGQMRRI
ncbi:MAG: S24 family peptidase [Bacteroidota bacterium]|nr:hypothetical protein [Candidatus Kapabacteria bacterium]MDW8220119.1 S24 family peptidase [Bacteroidota bacterium]